MTKIDTVDIFNAFVRKLEYLKHDLKQTFKYFSVLENKWRMFNFIIVKEIMQVPIFKYN